MPWPPTVTVTGLVLGRADTLSPAVKLEIKLVTRRKTVVLAAAGMLTNDIAVLLET
jgi:hypothetical protein